MEPIRPRRPSAPGNPGNSPGHASRPLMSDFGPGRPAGSSVLKPMNSSDGTPPRLTQPTPANPAGDADLSLAPPVEEPKAIQTHHHKERHETGHAGLVGWLVFVLLVVLLFSPFLPGKILDSFPGSSASVSSGDDTLACIDDLKNVTTTQAYSSRLGAPIVYTYATKTTQQGECNGKKLTVVSGHTSQFNPLGAVVDLACALVIALIAAKLWKLAFGDRQRT